MEYNKTYGNQGVKCHQPQQNKKNDSRWLFFLLTVLNTLLLLAFPTQAQVTAVWDASRDAKTVGYKLYYGEAENEYTHCIDVGNQTSYVIDGLDEGKVYYAAVSAYDPYGVESDLSNKVTWRVARTYTLRVVITGAVLGGKVDKSTVTAKEGTIITITATPADGYEVKAWTGTDTVPAYQATINTVTLTCDTTVTVEFEAIQENYSEAVNTGSYSLNHSSSTENSNVAYNNSSYEVNKIIAENPVAETTHTKVSDNEYSFENAEMLLNQAIDDSLNENGITSGEGVPFTGCFIETAASGTEQEAHLVSIRDFRDNFLMNNKPGEWFVGFYYRHSPSIARYLVSHENIRTMVRGLLWPVIGAIEYPHLTCNIMIVMCFMISSRIYRRGMEKTVLPQRNIDRCYSEVVYN